MTFYPHPNPAHWGILISDLIRHIGIAHVEAIGEHFVEQYIQDIYDVIGRERHEPWDQPHFKAV